MIEAERPLLIASSLGRVAAEAIVLARVAERFALPVVAHTPRYLCLPTDHPLHHGFDPHPFIEDADLILVIEADVPWMPSVKVPPPTARVAHIGEDPAFLRYPMRSFPSHLSITANAGAALSALETALESRAERSKARHEQRRKWALAARRLEACQGRRKRRGRCPAHFAGVSQPLHRRDGR